MSVQGIYAIFMNDHCYYVGQSVDTSTRMSYHKARLRRGEHYNPRLQRKYVAVAGLVDFKILEHVTDRGDLTAREIHWINELHPLANISSPLDEDHFSSGMKGRKAWNSGLTKHDSIEMLEWSKKVGRKPGGTPWNKGLKMPEKSISTRIKQAASLRLRPFETCDACGLSSKALKRHFKYCKGVI